MKAVIVGCGRVGATLARELVERGHQVTVVDNARQSFRRLGSDFKGRIVLGSGVDQEVLAQAGTAEADCFISVTNGDNRNIMSAQVAREVFGVRRVMTRIYDPRRAELYREFGLYTYCPTVVGTAVAEAYFESGAESADGVANAARRIGGGQADA